MPGNRLHFDEFYCFIDVFVEMRPEQFFAHIAPAPAADTHNAYFFVKLFKGGAVIF
jgi:hypothetical protein